MTAVAENGTRTDTSSGQAELALDDIPFGEGRTVTVGEEQVAVFRLRSADGGTVVRAVSAVCPLHLHTYDLADGQGLTGQPALKVYAVEIADGKVVVSRP